MKQITIINKHKLHHSKKKKKEWNCYHCCCFCLYIF